MLNELNFTVQQHVGRDARMRIDQVHHQVHHQVHRHPHHHHHLHLRVRH
jgi:hypothetical protein